MTKRDRNRKHREIFMTRRDKTNVSLIGIYCLEGMPKRAHKFDAREILDNVLLDSMKYPSDNG